MHLAPKENFMNNNSHTLKEILSQANVWQNNLNKSDILQKDLKKFLSEVKYNQILFIGCGSTYYLSKIASATLSRITGIQSRALPSSEVWLYPGSIPNERSLLVVISRSGTTTETLRALERFRDVNGGPILAVTCYPQSPMAIASDYKLTAPLAKEKSVIQTRSFTSMLLLIMILVATLNNDNMISMGIQHLPEKLSNLMDQKSDIIKRIAENQEIDKFYFLGGGALQGIACEAALKLKEASLSYTEPFHFLEFRHGPMSIVNERTLITGLLSDFAFNEEIRVLEDMKSLGAKVLVVAEKYSIAWKPDYLIELKSDFNDFLRLPLYLPPFHLLAYYRAKAKGFNPDRPKHLSAVIEL